MGMTTSHEISFSAWLWVEIHLSWPQPCPWPWPQAQPWLQLLLSLACPGTSCPLWHTPREGIVTSRSPDKTVVRRDITGKPPGRSPTHF